MKKFVKKTSILALLIGCTAATVQAGWHNPFSQNITQSITTEDLKKKVDYIKSVIISVQLYFYSKQEMNSILEIDTLVNTINESCKTKDINTLYIQLQKGEQRLKEEKGKQSDEAVLKRLEGELRREEKEHTLRQERRRLIDQEFKGIKEQGPATK